MLTTKTIGTNYTLDILDVQDFKSYYYENKERFTATAMNAFLKTVDIPPKFFKEQPEATQDELLDNREYFVAERKKFVGKVIVVLKAGEEILNACRLSKAEAEEKYEALNTIDNITNKFEHRSFVKDGFTTFVVSENLSLKNGVNNQVLVVDFPLLLNKKPVIHKAFYTTPDETFTAPVEHIQYIENSEIELGFDYKSIEDAIKDFSGFLEEDLEMKDAEIILREPGLVSLALVELGVIPRKYNEKISNYISDNVKGTLTTRALEKLVLDFDEEMRKYKPLTSLRSINGHAVLDYLNSDAFKDFVEEMEHVKEDLVTL